MTEKHAELIVPAGCRFGNIFFRVNILIRVKAAAVRHACGLRCCVGFATLAAVFIMNTVHVVERAAALPAELTREACIRLLAQEVAELHFADMAELLAESALEREAEDSTYLGRGLAVPHARVAGLPAAAIYVACGAGVPWPDEAADCVALLCVPAECPELHLQLLSRVVRWRMKGGTI